jgi:hypothetical protein
MANRVRQVNPAALHSTGSDWLLLVPLCITGATRFLIELALYLPDAPARGTGSSCFTVASSSDDTRCE